MEKIKCERKSENPFSAFDLEFSNAFEKYVKKDVKIDKKSSWNSEKKNTTDPYDKVPEITEKQIKIEENGTTSNENQTSSSNEKEEKGKSSNNRKTNLKTEIKKGAKIKSMKSKPLKKTASLSKATKNYKKSYVPIQPKPVEESKSFCVRFEKNDVYSEKNEKGGGSKSSEGGVTLLDENDSQEPEEEIARYFKHLDENELNTNRLVDQAVKFFDTTPVQSMDNISEIMANPTNPTPLIGSEDSLGQPIQQQFLRSQSCFEVHREVFNTEEKRNSTMLTRSQSSVELPTSIDPVTNRETSDPGSEDKKKKISHLRILLERSISSDSKNQQYPCSVKNHGNLLHNNNNNNNPGIPDTSPSHNFISDANDGNKMEGTETNLLPSNVKVVDRNKIKLNGFKVLSKGPSFVPQSPNMRTKYFNFTPISPGPQSPHHKTPSSSASLFLSPGNTPVPRSKQNSQNDSFLSPLGRKSGVVRVGVEGPTNEFFNDNNNFNFSKNLLLGNGSPIILQGSRPRSYSSTNFYKSKVKRSTSKSPTFTFHNCQSNFSGKNNLQIMENANFPLNSPFSITTSSTSSNFISNESFSIEVQKLLDNNCKMVTGNQIATIRSRSVPLNRMISESSWIPNQCSSIYTDFCNTVNSVEGGKLSGLIMPNSTVVDGSDKSLTSNLSSGFINGDEISNLSSSGSLSSELFSGGTTTSVVGTPQMENKFFVDDFGRRSNEDSFVDGQSFNNDNSTFSNKLDLNCGGEGFETTFSTDADTGITDTIKSYLPDFENLDDDNGDHVENVENDNNGNDRKLFLNEGGNENIKDPVITSFKPVIMNDLSNSPGSPVLNNFFTSNTTKINDESQQHLIEFFNFED